MEEIYVPLADGSGEILKRWVINKAGRVNSLPETERPNICPFKSLFKPPACCDFSPWIIQGKKHSARTLYIKVEGELKTAQLDPDLLNANVHEDRRFTCTVTVRVNQLSNV